MGDLIKYTWAQLSKQAVLCIWLWTLGLDNIVAVTAEMSGLKEFS